VIDDTVATTAAVLAGGTLVVAGALKLARPSWQADAAALGVPTALARPVPVVELLVGSLLAVGLGTTITGGAAAALYLAFTALLVRRLRAGARPVCACFGAFSRRPISWWSVVRNLVLTMCAVLAIR
jgi:uncharacterized membrane protein YphA (DoxX/SURF4 family)